MRAMSGDTKEGEEEPERTRDRASVVRLGRKKESAKRNKPKKVKEPRPANMSLRTGVVKLERRKR